MTERQTLTQDSDEATRDLLVGRRIVKAEMGEFKYDHQYYSEPATGRLTLDDGTHVLVKPNIGGCSCGAGDYDLTSPRRRGQHHHLGPTGFRN